MSKDMTSGKPLPLLIRFFIPLLLGNLFQQLYSMVDSIIVGKFVGVNALAGVGATGAFNFLILGFAMGITTGFGVMVGQRFGAKDYRSMRNYIFNGFILLIIFAAVLTPLTMFFCEDILRVMRTPADIFQEAYDYIIWILAGILLTMLYNAASAILRAMGDSKTPLYALIAASVLNIVLDLLFVLVFRMGTAGVAVATVISQGVSGVVCLIYMFRHYEVLQIQREEKYLDLRKIRMLLYVGIPMALQFSITAIGTVILQSAVNTLGAAAVAAMTAGSKISFIFTGMYDSLGAAMATYCSQNLGAGEYKRIHRGIIASFCIAAVLCGISIIVVLMSGRYIAFLFIDPSETALLEQIQEFLIWNAAFFPALALLLILRNSLQGMGYSFVAMFAGVSELVGRAIVAFLMVGAFGFTGACMANPAAWIFASVLLVVSYFWAMKHLESKRISAGTEK